MNLLILFSQHEISENFLTFGFFLFFFVINFEYVFVTRLLSRRSRVIERPEVAMSLINFLN